MSHHIYTVMMTGVVDKRLVVVQVVEAGGESKELVKELRKETGIRKNEYHQI